MTTTHESHVTQTHDNQALKWPNRAANVAATTAVTAAMWSIVTIGFNTTIYGPSFDGAPPSRVGLGAVVAATLMAGLAGWVVLACIERWTSRPRSTWTRIATIAAVISLGGPLTGSAVTATDRVALVAVHLLVAALYIPLMRKTMARGDKVTSQA